MIAYVAEISMGLVFLRVNSRANSSVRAKTYLVAIQSCVARFEPLKPGNRSIPL